MVGPGRVVGGPLGRVLFPCWALDGLEECPGDKGLDGLGETPDATPTAARG
jgi:hypothetical protein